MANEIINYSDPATRLTDKKLTQLEKRIGEAYADAANDIEKTIAKYWADFIERDDKMQIDLRNGKITKEYYKQWRLNQIGRGRRLEALRDDLAQRIFEVNEVATAYINDATPGIYTLNRAYVGYTLAQVGHHAAFTIWDEQTIKRLIMTKPQLMPYYPPARAIKRGIDLKYSKKVITNAITTGILTGKPLPKIANDLQRKLITMSRDSANRAARTAFTGAQNGGRVAGMSAALDMGIDVQKQWLTCGDARVRKSHIALDGEIVPVKETFWNGLLYPGDPDGEPAEVYNCRCTLLYVVDGESVLDKQDQLDSNFNKYLEDNGI